MIVLHLANSLSPLAAIRASLPLFMWKMRLGWAMSQQHVILRNSYTGHRLVTHPSLQRIHEFFCSSSAAVSQIAGSLNKGRRKREHTCPAAVARCRRCLRSSHEGLSRQYSHLALVYLLVLCVLHADVLGTSSVPRTYTAEFPRCEGSEFPSRPLLR